MVKLPEHCLHCGSDELYTREMSSSGEYGPQLLAGLSGFWRPPKFDRVLGGGFGRCKFLPDVNACTRVVTAKGRKRVAVAD